MFLSRIILNCEQPDALRAVANPYRLHQLLWRAFPHREEGGVGRVLFRLETQQAAGSLMILVQSDLTPDWSTLGELMVKCEYRLFSPQLATGQTLRFRLRANPTKRLPGGKTVDITTGKAKDGKRVQLYGEEEQLAWLCRKGEASGFSLLDCRVSATERQVSRKEGKTLVHQAVLFDGRLSVTDPETFLQTLTQGIGAGKGFGFGLLSIALR